MQYEMSVKIGNREVYRSPKPRKIAMVADVTAAVLRELDAAPDAVVDWDAINISIHRE